MAIYSSRPPLKLNVSASARAAADALVKLDPENPGALALRGKLSYRAGDIQSAKRDLLRVLSVNPADSVTRYGLAVIYEQEGDFKSARSEWETLLQTEPGNAAAAQHLKNLPG